jgi:branched-chain amino acid transport system substrate-binding protein
MLRTLAGLVIATAVLGGLPACGGAAGDEPIRIGLMLSFTGALAAGSVNSERALTMAIDAANQGGGVEGRRLQVFAHDTRSDTNTLDVAALGRIISTWALLIGPDYGDFLTHLRPVLVDRTVLLPSYATVSDGWDKPASWFLMGPSIPRLACELMAQVAADGRHKPLHIVTPGSYNGTVSYVLSNMYQLPKHTLSKDLASNPVAVRPLQRALLDADAYLLLAPPGTASTLVYTLKASGALPDPKRWYLSPTLHTPEFLESIPKGALQGAQGVSSGTVAGAADFRRAFSGRWHEPPFDNAYAFYDAGAIAALAIQRALLESSTLPSGTDLSRHVIAVTGAGGTSIRWNEIGHGLDLLRRGEQVQYVGLTGSLQFDQTGKPRSFNTNWWSIADDRFVDIPRASSCE